MAGGSGTRLRTLTKAINKHLLPVYDKPLIYYPIATLMLAGIREIQIVTNPDQVEIYRRLLGDGSDFGISISIVRQEKPGGIAEGILISERFIEGHKLGMILGDNVFHGHGLGRKLAEFQDISGCHIFAYPVANPKAYGVVQLDSENNVVAIEEKPNNPKSNLAVTGLYFYDEELLDLTRTLKPSMRGELEITDVNRNYLEMGKLRVTVLSRGTAWLDTGTFEGLHDASSYIRILQERQNASVGNPRDVAITQGWI